VVDFADVAPIPLVATLVALVLAALAEAWHARRVRRLAPLAFGPNRLPAAWALCAPYLRVAALGALTWGLATLLFLEPRRFSAGLAANASAGDFDHVLIVLDVSPSMRLVDAGPEKNQSRMQRARSLIESFFDRVPIERSRVSVVAVYNGAKPVVIDTRDFEVVRNIFGDLPMHFAFRSGKTKLFDGLEEAARIAKPWNPRSTTLLVISDGDTVPATGMPKMPASVRSVLVVGVGDPQTGKFIDGRQSRQDVPTLKQIAARLGGSFHDGNGKHLSSSLIASTAGLEEQSIFEKLTRREYALLACAGGASILSLLPLLLHFLGTRWRPGTKRPLGDATTNRHSPARAQQGELIRH
jgi:Ca-activated chloride channel family protein